MFRPLRPLPRNILMFLQKAHELAERPGLERTSSRPVRRLAIGDLGEMAEPGVPEMAEQRRDESLRRLAHDLAAASAHADPRLDEGPHQPGPHGPLVIGAVTLHGSALVASSIARLVGR